MIVCIGFIAVLSFYQPILQFLTAIPMENGVSGLAQYKDGAVAYCEQNGN